MRLQAVVFDFDGVIADTEPLHLVAFQRVLAQRHLTLTRDEYFDRYLGYDDATLLAELLRDRDLTMAPEHSRAVLAEKTRLYHHLIADSPPTIPGVADRIRAWSARVPVAVASGALREEIEEMLTRAGVTTCVRVIVAAGEVASGKPAPDPYRRAVELLETERRRSGCRSAVGVPAAQRHSPEAAADPIDPARCVAIEDSHWGIESARAAGLRTVAVTTSYRASALAGADLVVDGVTALDLDQLERLCATVAPRGATGR